jgi:hypothetical protein
MSAPTRHTLARSYVSGRGAPSSGSMMRKPLELPPEAARSFFSDMRAFFAAKGNQRELIAVRQLHLVNLRSHHDDVKQLSFGNNR